MTSRPYEETLTDILRASEDMTTYLNEAMEDEDPRVFLLALQDVVRSQGMSQVSRKTGVNRQSLYKVLSGERTPRVDTLNKVLHALGLRLAVEKAA
jgi:probable addiction module antidote protein